MACRGQISSTCLCPCFEIQMGIQVLEISRIVSPERILRRLDDFRSRRLCLGHYTLHGVEDPRADAQGTLWLEPTRSSRTVQH